MVMEILRHYAPPVNERERGGSTKTILIFWLLAMGFIFGPVVHEACLDYQTDQADYQADVVESNQS
jgi:hypothetical protein